MSLDAYLKAISDQLVAELRPVLDIKELTSNPVLLGAYTEAALRNLIKRVVFPMRICTGAVLDYPMPEQLRQIDVIVWAPYPAPAIHEVEGFGLVPRSSSFGVMEIKRSNYSGGVTSSLESFLGLVDARRIVSDPRASVADYSGSPGLGIICALEKPPSKRLRKLLDSRRVIAVFDHVTKGRPVIRRADVLTLVNYLHFVTWRYRVHGSMPGYPQVALGEEGA